MKVSRNSAVVIALMLLLTGRATAQEFVMKFGTASVNDPQTAFMKMYKEELERRSAGRIKVDLYLQSQLGAIPRQIEGVQLGTIEAFIAPVDFFTGVDQRFGVFSTPMLFRDEAHAESTIHDPALQKSLLGLAEPKGIVGIGTVALGAANYAGRTPLLRLADFKGKKLRINGTFLERSKMSRLGATGVAMPLSEVAPALSQGTIDGTISIMSIFVSFKMNDLVKIVTVTNDTMIVSIAVVSKTWLNGLPPDLRQAVIDSGDAIRIKLADFVTEFNKAQSDEWIKMGGQIHKLSPDDLAAAKTLLSNVGDEVTKDQPAVREMLVRVREVAGKH
jgi:TRAP-type C4-dicarboxylate transport system substrate-binding protein